MGLCAAKMLQEMKGIALLKRLKITVLGKCQHCLPLTAVSAVTTFLYFAILRPDRRGEALFLRFETNQKLRLNSLIVSV